MTALILGVSGIVGTELRRCFQSAGIRTIGVARRARPGVDIAASIGSLRRDDLAISGVVNLVASTRWNAAEDEARIANVDTAAAAARVFSDVPLVHVSTSYLGDLSYGTRADREAFRNAYEWSKAESEVAVSDHPMCSIIRVPQLIGSSVTGEVSNETGLYQIFRGVATGLMPLMVGEPDIEIDVAGVDHAAAAILDIYRATISGISANRTLSCGANAPTTAHIREVVVDEINQLRLSHQLEPLPEIPIVSLEVWDRLYWPFVCDHLSSLQRRAIELTLEFSRYTTRRTMFADDIQVPDPIGGLRRAVSVWASSNERLTTRSPRTWKSRHAA